MRRVFVVLSTICLVFGLASPALAGTGKRSKCGTHVSAVNDMNSRTGSYKVKTYPKACYKSYFDGSRTVYYMPWTKTPVVSIQGVTVGSDATMDTPPHVAKKIKRGTSLLAVRYDWTIKLKTSGGSTYNTWQIWVYPTSGTQIVRIEPNKSTYDPMDPWDS